MYLLITAEKKRNLLIAVPIGCQRVQAMRQDTPPQLRRGSGHIPKGQKLKAYKRPRLSPHVGGGGEMPRTGRQPKHCWSEKSNALR